MPEIELPKVAVLTCAVMEDEIRHFVRGLKHLVRFDVLPQGLHNDPPKLRRELQQYVNMAEAQPDVEAIVLGYGLCSRGIEDVVTRRVPMIVARAHDCITLLLGGKERYAQYVQQYPGTYWYSPGWNKHHLAPGQERYHTLRQQYVEKFGEDDADYLMEQEQAWFKAYHRATYVDLGVTRTEDDIRYTQECAQWLGWEYDQQKGDPSLMKRLLSGPWDDKDFLVIKPGETFRMTADERVIEAVPITIGGKAMAS